MLRYLGYVSVALSIGASASRTCRLSNATPQRLRALIRTNLRTLRQILEFNALHDIFFYRISSQIIPFGSHPVNAIAWWDEFGHDLAQLGDFIRRHRMRVSMHPGQFTVLGSPNRDQITLSVAELRWHGRFLDSLEIGAHHKITVHVGGAYGNKREAIQRFTGVANNLPLEIRRRVVIENDERLYTAADVVDISRDTGLPVEFDRLHHAVNPGARTDTAALIRDCFDTWQPQDGVPITHFSTQAPDGRPGRHADWIDPSSFEDFLRLTAHDRFDCMLEAKCKDRALLRLRQVLASHGVVEAGPG